MDEVCRSMSCQQTQLMTDRRHLVHELPAVKSKVHLQIICWLCRASRLNLCQPAEIHSFKLKLKSTLPRRLWISRSCSLVSGVVQLHQGLLNGNFPKGSPQCGAHTPFIWEFWTDLTVFCHFMPVSTVKETVEKWKFASFLSDIQCLFSAEYVVFLFSRHCRFVVRF